MNNHAILEAASDVLVEIAHESEAARELAGLLGNRISDLIHIISTLQPAVWWRVFREELGQLPILLVLGQITLGRGLSSSEIAEVLVTTDHSVRRRLHELPLVTLVSSERAKYDNRRIRYVLVPPLEGNQIPPNFCKAVDYSLRGTRVMDLLDIDHIAGAMAEAWQTLSSVDYIEAWLEVMAEVIDEVISLGVQLRGVLERNPPGIKESQRVQNLLEALHRLRPFLRERETRRHLAKQLSDSVEEIKNHVEDQLHELGVLETLARVTLANVAIELARGVV